MICAIARYYLLLVSPLVLQAVLSRFFPVYNRMRDILKSNRLGDIKMVTAYMGQNSMNSQRHMRKELGAGALKDVGGYTLQFALQVLGNDMPDKIHAVAQLNNECKFWLQQNNTGFKTSFESVDHNCCVINFYPFYSSSCGRDNYHGTPVEGWPNC